MSCYETIDTRFGDLIDPVAFLETIHTGNRWAEGPVYFADLRSLIWSDIPNDRMLRWDEETGAVSLFRGHVSNPNGNTRDRNGRLVTCIQGERRVVRTEWDGAITVLADSFDGKPLNSPNDVVVKSDGSIWFTDPNYGIISDYVGRKGLQEQPGCRVYISIPVRERSPSLPMISPCRTGSPSRPTRSAFIFRTPASSPTAVPRITSGSLTLTATSW